MKNRFLRQAGRQYSPKTRFIVLLADGAFFLIIVPSVLVYLSTRLDLRFDFQKFEYGIIEEVVGLLLALSGFLFACWAIWIVFAVGRGTPIPLVATQKLIVQRPYAYCRNPMAFGTIVLYLGAAVSIGSIAAVLLVLLITVLVITYIKFLEEKEMASRFGKAYQVYKKQTPFMIPRLRRKKYSAESGTDT